MWKNQVNKSSIILNFDIYKGEGKREPNWHIIREQKEKLLSSKDMKSLQGVLSSSHKKWITLQFHSSSCHVYNEQKDWTSLNLLYMRHHFNFFLLTKLFSKEIIIFFLQCRVGHLDKRPLVQTWNYAKDKLSFSREMNLGAFYNLAQIFIYGQWNSSLKGKILIVSKVNLFPTTVYVFLSSQ